MPCRKLSQIALKKNKLNIFAEIIISDNRIIDGSIQVSEKVGAKVF